MFEKTRLLECSPGMQIVKTFVGAHEPTLDQATHLPWDSPLQLLLLLIPRNAVPVGMKAMLLKCPGCGQTPLRDAPFCGVTIKESLTLCGLGKLDRPRVG